jgi:hypothetical protein
LGERSLTVECNGIKSKIFKATSGLPQGSHFGPILFSIFINDLPTMFSGVECVLFADDLKIYKRINCINDCIILQDNINILQDWCKLNNLFLNTDKCYIMTFSRNKSKFTFKYCVDGQLLKNVTEIRDLGILFDSELSFVNHINESIGRAMQTLGFIVRTTVGFRNTRAIGMLYTSMVRSTLEYCSVLWDPFYNIHTNNIEKVQRKFLRYINFVMGIPKEEIDYNFLHKKMDLIELKCRREILALLFFYKIINGHIDSSALVSEVSLHVPSRTTRNINTFHVGKHRTNYARNSIMPRLHTLANTYLNDIDIFCTNFSLFRSLLLHKFFTKM